MIIFNFLAKILKLKKTTSLLDPARNFGLDHLLVDLRQPSFDDEDAPIEKKCH